MGDPFLIQGPALISFSGGRTSAYMLWRILQAHGGKLPADVVVGFANTGKEREETLRFVHECGSRWNVPIAWLEWRDGHPTFAEVGFTTASRAGEPFAALIDRYGYPPNGLMRFCTGKLKIQTMRSFMRALGLTTWTSVVGLRFDEGHRVLKQQAANAKGAEPFIVAMPLAEARLTKRDVMAFWAGAPFDLQLRPGEGNCDLCFLKGRALLASAIRTDPSRADWWVAQEERCNRAFNRDLPLAQLRAETLRTPLLPFLWEEQEHDAECGDMCGGDGPDDIAALQAQFEREQAGDTTTALERARAARTAA